MNVLQYLRERGLKAAVRKAQDRLLHAWDQVWQQIQATPEELNRQRANQPTGGLISVAVPVYNTKPELLEALGVSLASQTYVNWEACLYSTGTSAETDAVLDRLPQLDRRIRVQRGKTNEGVAGNTNRAAAMCRGEWLVLCDHDDVIPPDALWRVAEAAAAGNADVIYTDEDRITVGGKRHTDPALKPDFSPDTLRSVNYICHMAAIRKDLWDRIGGERPKYDGAQDHDLMLRLSEVTSRFVHITAVCYHWRRVKTSVSHLRRNQCLDASRRAVESHMERIGWPGTVRMENGYLRLHYTLRPMKGCVIVTAPTAAAAEARIDKIRHFFPWHVNFRTAVGVHRIEAMNQAAASCDDDLLLFVDSCVDKFSEGFWDELAMYAQRDDVGMVVPLLTDHIGTVLHAGYAVGVRGGLQSRCVGQQVRGNPQLALSRNVGAVSPLCFMVRKAAWQDFDTAYYTAFGCADVCMRMLSMGLHHVYTPHARATIHGRDDFLIPGPERGQEELERLKAAWPDVKDPCWNPGLSDEQADYTFRRMNE